MSLPNKGFILVAATVTSVLAGVTIHQMGEIGPGDYRTLRDGFKHGSPAYRLAIAEAMHSGDISRWEYRHLLDQYQNENAVSLIDNDASNLREERLVLAAMTRQLKPR